ncbi:hypothetical protein Tco_1525827 [Tanacetum coccineum]
MESFAAVVGSREYQDLALRFLINNGLSLENPVDFEEEILDAEVQQNKAIPLFEEEIALDVASSEGTMSGLGSGGEEVDYDMTNYGDDY